MPNAYIFSGLPGVSKTTLAKLLAKTIPNTTYYRVDTIEYFFKKEYAKEITKQGYELAFYQAKENLELGSNIIIDCCNPVDASRKLWNKFSNVNSTRIINIEIICSDRQIHQDRVEMRFKTDQNKYPSWQDILNKGYKAWNQKIIRIDTACNDIDSSFRNLMNSIDLIK